MENVSEHILTLTNREKLTVTGVNDVDAFNEEEISAICSCGELTIKSDMLHIEKLNVESGFFERQRKKLFRLFTVKNSVCSRF
ncbi:MAG: YabP/YqfC family sporulation protein [Clostridiales bacterium]|nr:YabP/YqfC family sporulation protein [Clostridiales bacterium]